MNRAESVDSYVWRMVLALVNRDPDAYERIRTEINDTAPFAWAEIAHQGVYNMAADLAVSCHSMDRAADIAMREILKSYGDDSDPITHDNERRSTNMRVRMLIDVAGTFHNRREGVKRGDTVELDEFNAARYFERGYCQPAEWPNLGEPMKPVIVNT